MVANRFGRRLAIGTAALVALLLLAGLALQTAPVRERMLRWTLERSRPAGVRIEVGRLDYNLAALRATVHDVAITALNSGTPFLRAEAVVLDLPWTVLTGTLAVQSLIIHSPRIAIEREADGTLNLPSTARRPGTEPMRSISIGRIQISGLAFHLDDRLQNVSVHATGIDLNMIKDGPSPLAGRLTASQELIVRVRDRQTTVTRLDGRLAFDGSTLTLDEVTLESPEMAAVVDGRVQLLPDRHLRGVRIRGSADLARIAPWASLEPAPAGEMTFSGSVDGPLDQVTLDISMKGEGLEWLNLHNLSLSGHAMISEGAVDVDSLRAGIGGGELIADGRIPLGNKGARARLRWQRIDVGLLVAALTDFPARIASTADGQAELAWNGMDVSLVSGSIENRLRSTRASRDSLVVEGRADLRIERGRWHLVHRHRIGSETRVTGQTAGQFDDSTIASTTLRGQAEVHTKLKSALRQLRSVGVDVNEEPASQLDGAVSAVVELGGTAGSPIATGTLEADNLYWSPIGPGQGRATFSATREKVTVESLAASIAENTIAGRASINLAAGTLEGRFAVDLRQLDALAAELPEPWRPAGSLGADVRLSGTLDSPSFAGSLSSEGLSVGGQTVTALRGSVSMADGVVNVDMLDATQRAGRLRSSGRYVLSTGRFEAKVEGHGLTIVPVHGTTPEDSPFPVDAAFDLRLSGRGTLDAPHADGVLEFSRLAVEGYPIGPAHVDLSANGGAIRVSAVAPELNGFLQAEVAVGEPQSFTAKLSLAGSSLARIVGHRGSETTGAESAPGANVGGSVSLRLEASGTLADLTDSRATVSVNLEDATVNGTPLRLPRPAVVNYTKNGIAAESVELYVGDIAIVARGAIGIDAASREELQFHLAGPLSDLVPLARLTPALDQFTASGTVDISARASGSLEAPRLDAKFSVSSASATHSTFPPVTGVTLQGAYTDGLLQVHELRAQWQDSTLIASGEMAATIIGDRLPDFYRRTLPETASRMRANLRLESLTQNAIAPFVSEEVVKQIAARFDVMATVEGDRLDVEGLDGAVTFERAELSLAGVPLRQTQPTRLKFADGRLDVEQWSWGGAGNQINVSGHADLGSAGRVDLAADGKIDLRMLGAFSPGVVTEGLGTLNVTVKGTTHEPAIEGQLALSGAGLVVRDPRLAVTDLQGIVTFVKDELRLQRVTASANGGTVSVSGGLEYHGFDLKGGTITLTGRRLAMELPDNLRSEINLDLRIAPAGAAPSVSGAVTVLRGSYREAISLAAQLLTTVETRRVAPVAREKPALVDTMALDVTVSTSEHVIVDNNYGRVEVASDLRIVGTLGEPVPTGRLTIREGGDIFLGGRTYEVVRGTVDFLSRARTEPTLDLALQTRVQQYDVTLEVTGTPETLKANLRSPGLSQTDVVSLLLTGQLAEKGAVFQTEVARSQLLMLLSGELLGIAGRAVGLDSVHVGRGLGGAASDFDLLATDTDPSARLTVSKDLNRDVSIVYSQSLRDTGDITWIAIYRPLNNIEVRGATQDDGSRSYEFRHELEFGGSRDEPAESGPRSGRQVDRVAGIRIFGTPGFDEREIRNRLRLDAGDQFDFYRWQRDRDRLERFFRDAGYLEARISARRATSDSASEPAQDLQLEYEIRRGPKTSLAIEGYHLRGDVVSEIERAWAWTVFDDFLLGDIEVLARQALVAEGYLQASVDAEIASTSNENAKHIVVRIVPGPHFRDRRVVFSGQARFSPKQLEADILRAPGLVDEMWNSPDILRTAIEQYYGSRGYLGVSVAVQAPVFTTASAVLPVRIDEGSLFTIGGLDMIGVQRRPVAEVRRAFDVGVGSPYQAQMLEPAKRAVEADYLRHGYNDVRVAVSAVVDDERSRVDVVLRVDEGVQQVLADVAVEGAIVTDASVIDRALDLEIGEPASVTDLPLAEKRLYDTGVFRTAGVAFEPIGANGTDVQQVRAHVTLSELRPYRFRYGFRLNDDMSPSDAGRETRPALVVDLLRRNLFGRAISAGVAGQVEPDRRLARSVVALPLFFGLPATTSFFMTSSREDFTPEAETPFVEDETSFTAEQRFRPTLSTSVSYGYSFSRTHIFEPEPIPGLPGLELLARVARLTGTFAWDRRDDPFQVRNGWFHTSGIEYGPASLGSDLRFIRYLAQQYYFKTLGRGVRLASGARIGLGRGFGQDLIRSEKFYAGGGTTIRGFAEDGIGEVDFLGDPIGGNSMLILNQELRFPVYRWFRGVTFMDAGNVFPTAGDFTLTDLEAGGGVGVRFDSPMGLLRVDFGVPFTDRKRQRSSRWYFGIGHAF